MAKLQYILIAATIAASAISLMLVVSPLSTVPAAALERTDKSITRR